MLSHHGPQSWLQTESCAKSLQSCLLFETLWTIARQAPLTMGFSRQEYWSRLPCPPPRDLPNSSIKPISPKSLALAGRFFTTSTTQSPKLNHWETIKALGSSLKVGPKHQDLVDTLHDLTLSAVLKCVAEFH